jgi:tRNA(Ile)-lysidine synthase
MGYNSLMVPLKEPPVDKVLSFLTKNHLDMPGETLLVAVSGGQDSVCLLHILAHFRPKLGLKLILAHLNHQLRGLESDEDAEYVAGLARALGIPAVIASEDVPDYQAVHGLGVEEAAREVRYRFLAQAARSNGARYVATGHTRDDQIETILMHLVRGSGLGGLGGLIPLSAWPYPGPDLYLIRPLLSLSRAETEDYCREHGLAPCRDASNLSLSPLRNRVRQELVPQLEKYNPQIGAALLRTGRLAREANHYLDAETERAQATVLRREGEAILLDKVGLRRLPEAIRRGVLRSAVALLLGSRKDIELRHVDILMEALHRPAGRTFHLPDGLRFIVEYQVFRLAKDSGRVQPRETPAVELKVPGRTELAGRCFTAKILRPEQIKAVVDPGTVYLDLDKTGAGLSLRARCSGDRFQPLGLEQTKKVSRFLKDARVPRAHRDDMLIVCSTEGIVWLAGLRLDERVKVTPATRRVLRLRVEDKIDPPG